MTVPDEDDLPLTLLADWADLGAAVAAPVEITAEAIPLGGVVLERHYREPLPAGAQATFAFYDPELHLWLPVDSVLSPDRTTLSATTDHLSLWTDVVSSAVGALGDVRDSLERGGAQVAELGQGAARRARAVRDAAGRAVVSVGDGAYYVVGALFDTRVAAPTCSGGSPEWVHTVTVMADHANNPLRWCTGQSADDPDLLHVVVRANRGYGYFVRTGAVPASRTNSTYAIDLQGALATTATPGSPVAESLATAVQALTGGGELLGGGEEMTFTFTREQASAVGDEPLVEVLVPSAPTFLVGVIAKQLVTTGVGLDVSAVSAVVAVAGCADEIEGADGAAGTARAFKACLDAAERSLGPAVTAVMRGAGLSQGAAAVGRAAETLRTVNVYLGVVGPALQTFSWAGDRLLPPEAWQLAVWVDTPDRLAGSRVWDVSAYDDVSFVSPSGAVSCTMDGWWPASCYISELMDFSTLPPDEQVCSDPASYGLGGVQVGEEGVSWFCTGEGPSAPAGQPWTLEFPAETRPGPQSDVAVVPYGVSVRHSGYTCSVAETGVSCSRDGSQDGFTVSSRGVETLDGRAPAPDL
ncbi:hypothetical protein [Pseudokineococcus sp. 1T1Z-3]|uniref:hypothetical protein n=1 Tax=Pseudokineococcus sp. 1T1Z-3 TaxID=3132745 RepID=UPI0030AF9E87